MSSIVDQLFHDFGRPLLNDKSGEWVDYLSAQLERVVQVKVLIRSQPAAGQTLQDLQRDVETIEIEMAKTAEAVIGGETVRGIERLHQNDALARSGDEGPGGKKRWWRFSRLIREDSHVWVVEFNRGTTQFIGQNPNRT